MTRRRAWILGAGGCAAVVILGGALLVLLAAQPVTPAVTTVQATMARALDARFNPLDPTGIFLPGETFYLSVRLEGAPANSMVTARWVYDGTPITQQDQALGGHGQALGPGQGGADARIAADLVAAGQGEAQKG